jgi:secondary thiamine-phosphate synthase enzyme
VRELGVSTTRRTELVDVTAAVQEALGDGQGRLAIVFVPHTTAGLLVQAHGAGATKVARDVETALERIVDESGVWQHTAEGDRNPWSHVRAALTSSSLAIPVTDGRLALGDLQAIFLCEFDGPRTRRLLVELV